MTSAIQEELFKQIVERRRFSAEMKQALHLIFIEQNSLPEAVAATGVSQHKLGIRRREVAAQMEAECPPGWRRATLYYPRVMQKEIDALAKKLGALREETLQKPLNSAVKSRTKAVKRAR